MHFQGSAVIKACLQTCQVQLLSVVDGGMYDAEAAALTMSLVGGAVIVAANAV